MLFVGCLPSTQEGLVFQFPVLYKTGHGDAHLLAQQSGGGGRGIRSLALSWARSGSNPGYRRSYLNRKKERKKRGKMK